VHGARQHFLAGADSPSSITEAEVGATFSMVRQTFQHAGVARDHAGQRRIGLQTAACGGFPAAGVQEEGALDHQVQHLRVAGFWWKS
jgi:hypothetical protein